jgi:hypothetical protein
MDTTRIPRNLDKNGSIAGEPRSRLSVRSAIADFCMRVLSPVPMLMPYVNASHGSGWLHTSQTGTSLGNGQCVNPTISKRYGHLFGQRS